MNAKQNFLQYFFCFVILFSSCKEEPLLKINLHGSTAINSTKKSSATFTYYHRNDSITVQATVRRRGGFSINFPKYSYSVSLEQPVAFQKLSASDDWIINANYIDRSFMRHKLSYDLFRQMNKKNIAPHSLYCNLYVSDAYNGLYVLMEKLNAQRLQLDKTDTLAMIFKDPALFRDDSIAGAQDALNYYQQEYPDYTVKNFNTYAKQFHDFLRYSDDKTFAKEIDDWIDIENVIDWHLLLLFTNNGDGVLKNFFLYKQSSETPFCIALWDYDHSFGRDGDSELDMHMDAVQPERNVLLRRLMQNDVAGYNEKLKARYFELKKDIFTTENIFEKMDENKKIIEPYLERNFAKWPVTSEFYKDSNDFYAELILMQEFVKKKLSYLDEYFAQ